MIENDKQLEVTREQIERLKKYKKGILTSGVKLAVDDLIYQAMLAGPQSLIDDMEKEIKDYEEKQ